MNKIKNGFQRSSIVSTFPGKEKLEVVVSELEKLSKSIKSSVKLQLTLSRHQRKWSHYQTSPALRDVVHQSDELLQMWGQMQLEFLQSLHQVEACYSDILRTEYQMHKSRKKEMKKNTNMSGCFQYLFRKNLNESETQDQCEVDQKTNVDMGVMTDNLKLIHLKNSMLTLAYAHLRLAANMTIVFDTYKILAEQLPDGSLSDSSLSNNLSDYHGGDVTREAVINAREMITKLQDLLEQEKVRTTLNEALPGIDSGEFQHNDTEVFQISSSATTGKVSRATLKSINTLIQNESIRQAAKSPIHNEMSRSSLNESDFVDQHFQLHISHVRSHNSRSSVATGDARKQISKTSLSDDTVTESKRRSISTGDTTVIVSNSDARRFSKSSLLSDSRRSRLSCTEDSKNGYSKSPLSSDVRQNYTMVTTPLLTDYIRNDSTNCSGNILFKRESPPPPYSSATAPSCDIGDHSLRRTVSLAVPLEDGPPKATLYPSLAGLGVDDVDVHIRM